MPGYDEVVSILQANNGSMTYRQLYDQVPFQFRSNLHRILEHGKQLETISNRIAFVPNEGVQHTVSLIGA